LPTSIYEDDLVVVPEPALELGGDRNAPEPPTRISVRSMM
jgi:hypothetical protein